MVLGTHKPLHAAFGRKDRPNQCFNYSDEIHGSFLLYFDLPGRFYTLSTNFIQDTIIKKFIA